MASSGSFTTSAYYGAGDGYMYAFKVSWKVTGQSIENNTSSIYWEVVPVGNTGNHWVTCGPIIVNLNGSNVVDITGRVDVADPSASSTYSHPWKKSGSFSVTHDVNGNAKITGWAKAAIYSSSVNSTYSNYSIDLPQIPRKSTVTASNVTLGNTVSININRASSSFTHTIRWAFGNKSGTIATKTSNTSVLFPTYVDLALEIPNSTTGTCTIYCDTYSGDTLIGTTTYNITLSVPSNIVPTIKRFTSSIASTNPPGCGLYVKNNSTVKWTASSVSGAKGSTIKKCVISGPNLSYETNSSSNSYSATSSTLTTFGEKTYTVTVTDSRGRSASMTNDITVVDYNPPTIKSAVSFRSNVDGLQNGSGTYVTHRLSINYYSLNSKNSVTVKVFRKLKTEATYSNQIIIPTSSYSISGSIITVTYTYPTTTFPVDKAYNFKFIVSDATGSSVEKETYVGTKNVPINITKDNTGTAIGGFAQSSENGRFDCHWDAYFVSSPIVGSDRKLKNNIKDIDVNIIDLLRPVKYNLKNGDTDTTHYGFVAQDVEQALIDSGLQDNKPGIIHYDKDEVTKEKINYALAYEELIPFLVKKCQELQREIDKLKGE